MQVIDEITRELVPLGEAEAVVVSHIPGCLVYGYTSRPSIRFLAVVNGNLGFYYGDLESLRNVLVFSVLRGYYISTVDLPIKTLIAETCRFGFGQFPYSFAKRYEAIESFNIFEGKQKILKHEEFEIAKHLKFSYGLEFETSMGYVPEDVCFRDGLIPLRDGSIKGLEYSTVVLEGNDGLCLLKQQLNTLKKYTAFNKECSLHIHIGGFKLDPNNVFRIYSLCKSLEPQIEKLVPPDTFYSSRYKENGKDYCKKLQVYQDFEQLYESLVGRKFYGSFTQPHPNDVYREAKWRIPTRYYWVNFVNTLCYNVNKTIEFRLLRPSYSFEKILIWLAIFNGIIMYAEKTPRSKYYKGITLERVITTVYPEDLANYIMAGIYKLSELTVNQVSNGDTIGREVEFENILFPPSN